MDGRPIGSRNRPRRAWRGWPRSNLRRGQLGRLPRGGRGRCSRSGVGRCPRGSRGRSSCGLRCAARYACPMHAIVLRTRRCLFFKELETSTTANTCSMVREQHRSICNIHKLIRQRCGRRSVWHKSDRGIRKCTKGKHILIKNNVTRNVNAIGGNM